MLAKNDDLAARNRAWLGEHGVTAVNLMSSPGAGKTTLLEHTIAASTRPVTVIEGDQETVFDAERIRRAGARAVQVNTGAGCHLDAAMVARALEQLHPEDGSLLFVENVGNLVCPALFDLGEHRKVVVISVTEGDDKPLKYPHMFAAADLVVVNKTDLLPYVDFDLDRLTRDARSLNPALEVLAVSARTGTGTAAWREWLEPLRDPPDVTLDTLRSPGARWNPTVAQVGRTARLRRLTRGPVPRPGTRCWRMPTAEAVAAEDTLIHVLWINAGLSCDGDSVALTAATQPSIEEIALGALPGLPKIAVHWPLIDFECGPAGGADDFLEWFFKADRGELDPFVLVVEGSIPNEQLHDEGYWCGFGNDPATGQPMTTSEWLDRLTPKATAVVAVGTCATYGGIHAMAGNPTGAMGVPDYLGWEWRSKAGIPIVCVPGCPAQPDNMSETLTYLLYMATGQAPMIPLDDALRPTWLFGQTVHEGCDRAGYYEQGDFAVEYGSPKCIVKLGCWGPTVKCNVPKRGWLNGLGGCPNVGGICIGCTMPGFPDKFMPFMDEPPGGKLSTTTVGLYGNTMRRLRQVTTSTLDKEPKWRRPGRQLTTGATRTW